VRGCRKYSSQDEARVPFCASSQEASPRDRQSTSLIIMRGGVASRCLGFGFASVKPGAGLNCIGRGNKLGGYTIQRSAETMRLENHMGTAAVSLVLVGHNLHLIVHTRSSLQDRTMVAFAAMCK